MKKVLSLLLMLVILFGLSAPASAAHVSGEEAISALETLGLVKGTGSGFESQRSATRAEALVMLLRLLGVETAAKSCRSSPFSDGGWAASYIGYAAEHGLVKGVSDTKFGSGLAVSARDYLTMVLRALGYREESGDFTWEQSIAFADGIGLTHGEYTASGEFLREDLALVSYTALTLQMKDSNRTLAEQLYLDGVISAASLKATRLGSVVPIVAKTYNAAEIHELGASAIVYMEMFENDEQLRKGEAGGTGSGFFVTSDGVIAMSYHELNGKAYARATTLDGHSYDVTGVLYYNPARDIALVRVSRTDINGVSVRFFPYLDLGDSDLVAAGETVYTLSNALARIDNITAGIVSNRSRIVDDAENPFLQITASISQGSSGGALLNSSGQVIGVLYGAFSSGNDMYLAVPINCLKGISMTGSGTPLTRVCETENAKKAAATIKAVPANLTLHIGDTQKVMITSTYPGQTNLQYDISSYGIVSCSWNAFINNQSIPLSVTGLAAGETEVTVRFADGYGNDTAEAVIRVTVLP